MVPGSMHVSNEARPIRLASMHAVSIRQKFSHAGMVHGVRVVVHSNYMLVGVTGSKAAPVSAAANVHTAPYRTSRRRCAIRSGAIWDAFSPVGIVWSVEGAVDRTSMAVEATGIRAVSASASAKVNTAPYRTSGRQRVMGGCAISGCGSTSDARGSCRGGGRAGVLPLVPCGIGRHVYQTRDIGQPGNDQVWIDQQALVASALLRTSLPVWSRCE